MKFPQLFETTAWMLAATFLAAAPAGAADLLVNGASQAAVSFGQNLRTATVHITSSDGSAVQYVVSKIATNLPVFGWIALPSGSSGTTPADLTITVIDISAFGAGPFTAKYQVFPVDGNGQSAIVNISDTPTQNVSGGASGLTVDQSSVSLSYVTSSGSSQPVTLNISGASSYGVQVSTADGVDWLAVSDGTHTGASLSGVTSPTLSVQVGPSIAQLANGTYQGTVTLTASDNSHQTVSVTLTVGSSGTGGNNGGTNGGGGNNGGTGNNGGSGSGNSSPTAGLVAGPSGLTFYYEIGTPIGQIPPQAVVISSPAGATYSVQANQPWVLLGAPTSGTIPGTVTVAVNPGSLMPNTYSGMISIASPFGSANIPVQLVVTNSPVVSAVPAYVTFTSDGVTTAPASRDVALVVSDGSPANPTGVTGPPWVTATLVGNTLHILPNTAGSSPGIYSDNLVVRAGAVGNSPLSIPVVLVLGTGASGTGLTVSSPSLSFQGTINGPTPAPTSVQVTAPAGTAVSVSSSDSWISVSPPGPFTNTKSLTVWVNPVGLDASVHTGAIVLSANGSTQLIPVTLTLTSGSGSGVDPASLNLTAQAGGAAVSAKLDVSLGAFGIPFTVTTSGSWLKAAPATGTTQTTVVITADPAGLAVNDYQGTVTITPTNGSPVSVPVAFSVRAAPTISTSTSGLLFFFRQGSDVPPGHTLPVSGTATGLSFTAQATSGSSWLSVSPASGITPANLNVTVNPAGLPPGTYTGTISLTGANGATGQAAVAVTLTVSPPLPTISRVANAASLASAAIAPGEIVLISGLDIGPQTPVTAQPDLAGNIATVLSGVQVLINGFPCPILAASSVQVTAMVPYEVAGFQTATIVVKYLGQTSNALSEPIADSAPGIYTQNGLGTGPAGFDLSANPVGPANPVARNGYVTLYLTGAGQTSPAGVTGKVSPRLQDGAPGPLLAPVVTIGGLAADWNYAGAVPGRIEGLMQINVQIPSAVSPGDLPVTVSFGGAQTQPGVTVSVD